MSTGSTSDSAPSGSEPGGSEPAVRLRRGNARVVGLTGGILTLLLLIVAVIVAAQKLGSAQPSNPAPLAGPTEPATTVSAPPTTPAVTYPSVYLTCTRVNAQGVSDKVADYTVDHDATGRPDFTGVWKDNNVSCITAPTHPEPVVASPVERTAVQASGSGAQASDIGTLYVDCAERFTLSVLVFPDGKLGSRVGEYRGALVLCPDHPDAKAIQAAIDASS